MFSYKLCWSKAHGYLPFVVQLVATTFSQHFHVLSYLDIMLICDESRFTGLTENEQKTCTMLLHSQELLQMFQHDWWLWWLSAEAWTPDCCFFYCYSFLCVHICYPSTYKCVPSLYEICDSMCSKHRTLQRWRFHCRTVSRERVPTAAVSIRPSISSLLSVCLTSCTFKTGSTRSVCLLYTSVHVVFMPRK